MSTWSVRTKLFKSVQKRSFYYFFTYGRVSPKSSSILNGRNVNLLAKQDMDINFSQIHDQPFFFSCISNSQWKVRHHFQHIQAALKLLNSSSHLCNTFMNHKIQIRNRLSELFVEVSFSDEFKFQIYFGRN